MNAEEIKRVEDAAYDNWFDKKYPKPMDFGHYGNMERAEWHRMKAAHRRTWDAALLCGPVKAGFWKRLFMRVTGG